MKKLIKLDIIEHICYDDSPCNSTLLIETENLDNLKGRIQAAFEEHIKKMGYKDMEDAKDKGVYFGNNEGFCSLSKELQEKYGFRFINPGAVLVADFDNGFNGW